MEHGPTRCLSCTKVSRIVHPPFSAAIVERCSVSWRRRKPILYERDQVSRLVLRNEQLNQACRPSRIAMTHP